MRSSTIDEQNQKPFLYHIPFSESILVKGQCFGRDTEIVEATLETTFETFWGSF